MWQFIASLALAWLFKTYAVFDPLDVFCGEANCYEVLGLTRDAEMKDIKKAYKKLAIEYHPDKNREENATVIFQSISKAHEVLTGNQSKIDFDWYLDHPREYYKVSGRHVGRDAPLSDVRVVIAVIIVLISWFQYVLQGQKYNKATKYLKHASLNNLGLKNGGTKQTLELYKRAAQMYEAHVKANKIKCKVKMQKDPLFEKFVDQLVSEVKVEGGYRKPQWNDTLVLQICLLPVSLYSWVTQYHRRYISTKQLSMEDMIDMASSRVGLGTWNKLSESEQKAFVEKKIWIKSNYDKWVAEQQEMEVKRLNKKKKKMHLGDDDDDYIE